MKDAITGLLIPFFGTAIGAACVYFMQKKLNAALQGALLGFAAGVMTAASIWSLLQPAIDQSQELGALSFFPALIGFWIGILFLLLLDRLILRLRRSPAAQRKKPAKRKETVMMVLAVTLHNIPEGMAVGVAYAGFLFGMKSMTASGALALSIGIAIQNIPEGAIISLPLRAEGDSRSAAFGKGVLSGLAEPVFGAITLFAAGYVVPALPYFLSFAAGAMLYVVTEELIPGIAEGHRSGVGIVFFAVGFTIMMALDVALG